MDIVTSSEDSLDSRIGEYRDINAVCAEKQQNIPTYTKDRTMIFHVCSASSIVVALLTLALFILTCNGHQVTTSQRKLYTYASPTPCGNSRTDALANHCVFDLMSFTWAPSACYDGALAEEFLLLQNWTWYHDFKATQPADSELVRRGRYPDLYVTWEYHKQHCAYMWRKLHRAMMTGAPVDGYVGNWNHTRHCLGQLDRKGLEPNKVNTKIETKFPSCGGVGADKL